METKPTTYTEDYVLSEVRLLLKKLNSSSKIIYIGELIDDRPYSRQRISEWGKQFVGEISDTIEKIKAILETRAVVGGLKEGLNPGMTKFHLINNYGWKDKQEVDHTTGGEPFQVNVVSFTPKDS